MKVLFIHRSVGQGIISKGNLRTLLNSDIKFDDFNHNTKTLTCHDGEVIHDVLPEIGEDTKPADIERMFASWPVLLDNYEVIAIKSCYPNSHIKTHEQLAKIKDTYMRMIEYVSTHGKHLLILTTPPLRPHFTNSTEILHADDLAAWLVTQTSDKVSVFDLRHLLSEKGVLKHEYRSWFPWDNHPNRRGYKASVDAFADILNRLSLSSKAQPKDMR